jgi:hypothetical protein
MKDHSQQRKTPIVLVKDGDPKKTLKKKMRCVTSTGTLKAPITTFTTSQTLSVPKTKKPLESTVNSSDYFAFLI